MNKFICLLLLSMVLGISNARKKYIQKFTFHRHAATFEEARNICRQEGGHLAVVTSKRAERKMLAIWARSRRVVHASDGLNAQAFIGLRLGSRGWKTIFGKYPPYLSWSQNWQGRRQPDNPTIQKCGSLLKKGDMDDVQCHYRLAFFCARRGISYHW